MDAIAYSHSAKQAKRIKKFINEPDSSSGVVTVPKVIASGETITIPAGRMAVLPNIQVDGTLNVQGDVFIPSGATMSKVVEKVTSTDNAIVRFNGVTGDVQNSGVIIDDNGNISLIGDVRTNKNNAGQGKIGNYSVAGYEGYIEPYDASGFTTITNTVGVSGFRVNTGGQERLRIDSAGNIGIGVTPSAWGSPFLKAIETNGGAIVSNGVNTMDFWQNAYYNGSQSIYRNTGVATGRYAISGGHTWYTAPSGTAGNAITWTNTMSLNTAGLLELFGATNSSDYVNLYLKKANGGVNVQFSGIDGNASTATWAGMMIGKYTVNSRSINATGTINASGADYAEYEYSNDITLVKGQIVGFKADGTLTDKYSEAIRFAIKSTNPSIVGGDTWGIEEIVGKRPERPVKSEEMTDKEFAELEELYKLELADFEVRLEVERQKVDRIAYAGKVPVNVYGAVAGQYVIAVEKDGGIDGKLVNKSDMTFAEYQDAVGRVNKILDDGRAEVAVIIH